MELQVFIGSYLDIKDGIITFNFQSRDSIAIDLGAHDLHRMNLN
jgi:hypothetical protein